MIYLRAKQETGADMDNNEDIPLQPLYILDMSLTFQLALFLACACNMLDYFSKYLMLLAHTHIQKIPKYIHNLY